MDTQFRFGEVRKLPENNDRTVEFIISNETKDRHGTVLPLNKWNLKNYKRNPVVGYQHNLYGDALCSPPNPDDIIGKSEVYEEDDKLIGRVTFEPAEINPLAEKIYQKVMFGTLRMASVGFIPTKEGKYGEGEEAKGAKNETYYFDGQELLEWSIVNIPSNPTAGKREFSIQTDRALRYVMNATGGKYNIEQIKDMPVRKIIELMTSLPGDISLEKDLKEFDNELDKAKSAVNKLNIETYHRKLKLQLRERMTKKSK